MSVRSDVKDLQRRTMVKTSRQGTFGGHPCTYYNHKPVNEVVQMILDYLGVDVEEGKPRLVKREES